MGAGGGGGVEGGAQVPLATGAAQRKGLTGRALTGGGALGLRGLELQKSGIAVILESGLQLLLAPVVVHPVQESLVAIFHLQIRLTLLEDLSGVRNGGAAGDLVAGAQRLDQGLQSSPIDLVLVLQIVLLQCLWGRRRRRLLHVLDLLLEPQQDLRLHSDGFFEARRWRVLLLSMVNLVVRVRHLWPKIRRIFRWKGIWRM